MSQNLFAGWRTYWRDETGQIQSKPDLEAAGRNADWARDGVPLYVRRSDDSRETTALVAFYRSHGGQVRYYGSTRRRGKKRPVAIHPLRSVES